MEAIIHSFLPKDLTPLVVEYAYTIAGTVIKRFLLREAVVAFDTSTFFKEVVLWMGKYHDNQVVVFTNMYIHFIPVSGKNGHISDNKESIRSLNHGIYINSTLGTYGTSFAICQDYILITQNCGIGSIWIKSVLINLQTKVKYELKSSNSSERNVCASNHDFFIERLDGIDILHPDEVVNCDTDSKLTQIVNPTSISHSEDSSITINPKKISVANRNIGGLVYDSDELFVVEYASPYDFRVKPTNGYIAVYRIYEGQRTSPNFLRKFVFEGHITNIQVHGDRIYISTTAQPGIQVIDRWTGVKIHRICEGCALSVFTIIKSTIWSFHNGELIVVN